MKPSRIRFLYLGRAASTGKALVDMLKCAGYTVTTETRAAADVTRKPSDLVIATQDELQRNHRRGARAVVVTAEAPSADGRGSRRGSAGAPAMNLQQLREHVRQTQGDVARRAAVSQPQLSRVEGRRDHLVSTLRKYVRALGGDVKVIAEIGTQRIVLRDV
ncbi:MAG: helix-turn-helix domain-containing protein [Polyangia bacterium]|jgi:Helix-turn-helix domain